MSDVREIILLLILVRIGLFSTVKLVYNGMSCGLVGRSCVYFGRLCQSFGYVCVVRLCVCRLVVLCVGWSCHVRISRSVNNERTHLMCMLFLVHYICRCSNRCHRKCQQHHLQPELTNSIFSYPCYTCYDISWKKNDISQCTLFFLF